MLTAHPHIPGYVFSHGLGSGIMPSLMISPGFLNLFVYVRMQAHLRMHGEVKGLADRIQTLRLGVQCL